MTPGAYLASTGSSGAANWIEAWCALAVAGGTGLVFAARRLRKARQRAIHMLAAARQVLADFNGTPARPGFPSIPGVMEQLQTLAANQEAFSGELAKVKGQVLPNGGSSLRDAVDDVAQDLREHREVISPAVERLSEDIAKMADRMDSYEDGRIERDRARYPGEHPEPGGN